MGGVRAQVLAWCVVPLVAVGGQWPVAARLPAGVAAVWAAAVDAVGWDAGRAALANGKAACTLLAPAGGLSPCVPAALLLPLAATWLLDLLVLVAVQAGRQRAALAQMRQCAGQPFARLPAGCSPALPGAWRPRLALPLDFERRFDAAEQAAVLAHEAAHLRRHDNRWNLLALHAAQRCWRWFLRNGCRPRPLHQRSLRCRQNRQAR